MIRFLADADFSGLIVAGCRRREPLMDILSAHLAGLEGMADPMVLALAAKQNRILLSHDFKTMPRHFGAFLGATGSSPGVFMIHQHASIADVMEALVMVWVASDADEWRDRILEIPFR